MLTFHRISFRMIQFSLFWIVKPNKSKFLALIFKSSKISNLDDFQYKTEKLSTCSYI